jgi:hypothetical protein
VFSLSLFAFFLGFFFFFWLVYSLSFFQTSGTHASSFEPLKAFTLHSDSDAHNHPSKMEDQPEHLSPRISIERTEVENEQVVLALPKEPEPEPAPKPKKTTVKLTASVPKEPTPPTTPPTPKRLIELRPTPMLEATRAALLRGLKGGWIAFSSKGRTDGVGAQALAKISAKVMATALDMRYVHMPFESLDHCEPGATMKKWCGNWEQLLAIGDQHKKLPSFAPHIKFLDSKELGRLVNAHPFNVGWAYVFRDCHSFVEHYHEELGHAWGEVISTLRLRYASQNERHVQLQRQPSVVNVAVHIRRGDAKERASKKRRWLSIDYFRRVMESLQQQAHHVGAKCAFHVVSEGSPQRTSP